MVRPLAVVVDDAPPRRSQIGEALEAIGCHPCFTTATDASVEVGRRRPEVVIVAANDADAASGVECLQRLHATFARPRYLFLASASSEELAVAAFHAGARRYLRDPWTHSMLQSAVAALLPDGTVAHGRPDGLVGGERLIGRSPAMRKLRAQIARVAPVGSNVLILGETGTGKELVAQLIHLNGARAGKPLVSMNTAAIPDALLENELFGHERGAFTGANTAQAGKLAAAEGGSVFLDEIGDMSLAIQAKLLRAIESKSIYRLGGARSISIDVRTIAATHHDLRQSVIEGRFRQDLYYRLNVVRVELPPLRERTEDIPLLVGHALLHFNREFGRSVRALSPRALETLCAYHWPGNVRELRNVVEALLVNLAPETTGVVDVPQEVMRQLTFAVQAPVSERERLLKALTVTNWNKTKAATELRVSRMTLYRKMQQHGVDPRG